MPAPRPRPRARPTKAESKAIKKGFLKQRSGKPTVKRIRVSTANRRYATVSYVVDVVTSTKLTPPGPEPFKKSGKSWKPVSPGEGPGQGQEGPEGQDGHERRPAVR